jgi:hypothetical protein
VSKKHPAVSQTEIQPDSTSKEQKKGLRPLADRSDGLCDRVIAVIGTSRTKTLHRKGREGRKATAKGGADCYLLLGKFRMCGSKKLLFLREDTKCLAPLP